MNVPGAPGKRWHTREDSGIRLDRSLRWWHDDELIEHPKIIEAFNVGLKVTEDNRFRLEFGNDWCFVTVEDAAYEVRAVDVAPGERLSIRLSDRTAEVLDSATLQEIEGIFCCLVKKGRAKARFSRDAQLQLGNFLEAENLRIFLRIGATRIPLPRMSEQG